jgi:hypothetical protein
MKPATHAIAQPEHLLRVHGLTPAHWFYLHLRSARSQRFLWLLQRREFPRSRKYRGQNQNHHRGVYNSHEIASELPQDHAIESLCLYFPRCLVPRGDSDRLRALVDGDDFFGGNERCDEACGLIVGTHTSNLLGGDVSG